MARAWQNQLDPRKGAPMLPVPDLAMSAGAASTRGSVVASTEPRKGVESTQAEVQLAQASEQASASVRRLVLVSLKAIDVKGGPEGRSLQLMDGLRRCQIAGTQGLRPAAQKVRGRHHGPRDWREEATAMRWDWRGTPQKATLPSRPCSHLPAGP